MERHRHRVAATVGLVLVVVVVLLALAVSTGAAQRDSVTAGRAAAAASAAGTGQMSDPVIGAAGDIACDPNSSSFNGGAGTATACRQRYTSDLLLDSTVFPDLSAVLALGDEQYEDGTYTKFLGSYDPSWGRVKALTRPVPGNHEYLTSGAAGYYQYFGAAAGDPAKGYYSFDLGSWHLIALNSNCSAVGGCGLDSPQEQWLESDLSATTSACVLAYWHHPRFSSGEHHSDATYDAFWRALYTAGADVVLVGHAHAYERFAPQNPDQQPDVKGIREFVVGTGGNNRNGFTSVEPTSEVRIAQRYGVLKLTLSATGYAWQFIWEADKSVLDSGSTACSDPIVPQVPAAPSLLAAGGGDGRVTLQWSPPASNGGSVVTNYRVYRGESSGGEALVAQVGNVRSYLDSGLTNGVTYWYRVSAVNAVGEGPLSNELSATPQALSVFVGDEFERSVASGLGTADVGGAWRVSSTARTKVQNGEAVVYGWSGGNQDVQAWQEDVRQDMEVLALVRLNATNPAGGSYKPRVVVRAQADARNGYYATITHTTGGALNWQLSRIDNAGGTGSLSLAAGTLLSSGAGGTSWWIRLRVQGTTIQVRYWRDGTNEPTTWKASVTDGYFASGRPSFGVSTGSGLSSPFPDTGFASFNAVDLQTSATAPGAPSLTSASANPGSVALQWAAPASNGGSPITGYKIYRGMSSGGETLLTQVGNVTSYTDTTVLNGTTYFYEVSAVNAVGEGPLSNELSAATPTIPGAPSLTSASAGAGSVALQWAAPASNGGSPITGYKIYRGMSSGGETLLTQVGNVTSYTDTTVSNGTTYFYEVSAVNAVGEGPLSNELSATPQALSVFVGDEFERSVASGFGTADVGGAWRVSSAARTKVQNGEAVVYGWSGGNQDVQAWQEDVRQDMEVLALVRLNATNPTGGSYKPRVVVRAQADARNGYYATITHTTGGALNWQLSRIDNAGGTGSLSLAAGTLLSSGAGGTSWWIRLRVQGTTIQVRYWRDGTNEPTTWKASVTDGYFASGRPSFGVSTGSGLSSPFPDTGFASFQAVDLSVTP